MGAPLAYFLSWSCYGTRLHGDSRGTVDFAHNAYGTPMLASDEDRHDSAEASMTFPAMLLDDRSRPVVHQAIEDHCRVRTWSILALNVRTTHVHVVVVAPQHRPEIIMGQLKAWATRRLREAGLADGGRVWAREGSTRHLFFKEAVDGAVWYVLHEQ